MEISKEQENNRTLNFIMFCYIVDDVKILRTQNLPHPIFSGLLR